VQGLDVVLGGGRGGRGGGLLDGGAERGEGAEGLRVGGQLVVAFGADEDGGADFGVRGRQAVVVILHLFYNYSFQTQKNQ
jgi:hypothetical protein